jgi:hypothetical protein
MQPPSETSPRLDALPSELRKQIVSYLAPSNFEDMRPGCKRHLQNANLAHKCLREWATEYMFRDIALKHVLPDASCHLEIFAVTTQNVGLLKYVKHVVAQVRNSRTSLQDHVTNTHKYHLLSEQNEDVVT